MHQTDQELLEALVSSQDENAFKQLVARHLAMVYATAHRMLHDTHLAEDVAQNVFLLLLNKAEKLDRKRSFAGWLYHTTRNESLHVLRSNQRRHQREKTAVAMNASSEVPNNLHLVQELESAMDDLESEDRDALILRFLEDRSLRDVGLELGVSEDAARKRVSRALEKLRTIFGKRGATVTSGSLTLALLGQAGTAVPVGLGISIAGSTLAGTSTATIATTQGAATLMNLFNLKTAAAIAGAVAITGTSTYLVKEREAGHWESQYRATGQNLAALDSQYRSAMEELNRHTNRIHSLEKDASEIHRLRAEIGQLNRELDAMNSVVQENQELRGQIEQFNARLRNKSDAAAGQSENQTDSEDNPPKLFTRVFQVETERVLNVLGVTAPSISPSDLNTLLSELIQSRSDIVMEPPEAIYLDIVDNRILVRADLEKLESIAHVLNQFGMTR